MKTKELRKLMEDLSFHYQRIEATICNDPGNMCGGCRFKYGGKCPVINMRDSIFALANELSKREHRNERRRKAK